MKVECKISAEYKEPYAVLHINKMTDSVGERKRKFSDIDCQKRQKYLFYKTGGHIVNTYRGKGDCLLR